MRRTSRDAISALVILCLMAWAPGARGQDPDAGEGRTSVTDRLVESITVTATKKSEAELAQDVPLSVSAFSGDQLDALKIQDIESLSFSMPNVALDSIGTGKGVANFAIRGLGINSSIPSIDPTVGVFIDGMYLGVNFGVVMDTFDLEAVEVLRGPQGLLFGRNVTGGAVLLRTRRPGEELAGSAKVRVETGADKLGAASLEGSVIEGLLRARISAQYRDDDGWFDNEAPGGGDIGEEQTHLIRPTVTFTPREDVDIHVMYEHGDSDTDGPAAQNRRFFTSDFDVGIDEVGFSRAQWDHVVVEANWHVPFGDGKITNIFGWRELDQKFLSDIDATPNFIFHAQASTEQDQVSNELRYSGRFLERWDLTVGAYYFTQDIEYRENRFILSGAIDTTGGGDQDQETWGLFTQSDVDITERLTLTAGLRYTYEEKDVDIAQIIPVTASSLCSFVTQQCSFNFTDDDDWSNWTPKVGFQYWLDDSVQLYAHYTKGFRSGGYNFRDTSFVFTPEVFDEEEQNSWELGLKSELFDQRLRINVAGFYNKIDDMQRELNLPDPLAGVVQIIRNTADATIYGVELDATWLVAEGLLLTANVGHTDGEYDTVRFDLNGDGLINGRDEDLDLPRLANWTYGIGATYEIPLDSGILVLRGNYAYRDDAAYTDNNLGELSSGGVLDASITFSPFDWGLTLSVFGRNLLDEEFEGNETILPAMVGPVALGGTFAPLKEGRVIGAEVRVDF